MKWILNLCENDGTHKNLIPIVIRKVLVHNSKWKCFIENVGGNGYKRIRSRKNILLLCAINEQTAANGAKANMWEGNNSNPFVLKMWNSMVLMKKKKKKRKREKKSKKDGKIRIVAVKAWRTNDKRNVKMMKKVTATTVSKYSF